VLLGFDNTLETTDPVRGSWVDFHTMLRIDGQWKITNKTATHATRAGWTVLKCVDLLAEQRVGFAQRLLDAYEQASTYERTSAFLFALIGGVHLTLALGHAGLDVGTTVLFALDGLAFIGAGVATFLWRGRQPASIGLLGVTLAAYLVYLALGREALDLVGAATYVVELTALGLLWIPRPYLAQPARR
jgi:hypothetical protein